MQQFFYLINRHSRFQKVYFLNTLCSLDGYAACERLHVHRTAVSEGPPFTRLPVHAPLWAHRALRPESLMLSGLSARTQSGFENPPSAREALRLTKCMCRTPLCSPCEQGAFPPAALTWIASDNTAHLTPSFHKQTIPKGTQLRSTPYEDLGSGIRAFRLCANIPDP